MDSTDLLDQKQKQKMGKPTLHCDLAIIGGGGAGMSILWSLAKKEFFKNHKVVLLEPEAKEADDRTWCFWAKPDDKWVRRLNPCISHKWTKAKNNARIDKLAPYAYYQVRSADFYAEVKRTFAHEKNLQWIREKAGENNSNDSKEIELSECTIKADHIFDSRVAATRNEKKPIELWQSFLGWRIRTKHPVLDPSTLELMNFDVPQKGETQFLYVLPTEENEILIELTRFGGEKIDVDWANQYLEKWVETEWGQFEILESESGAIPMSQSLDVSQKSLPPDTRRIPVGTAAGAVKPTTGYAFYQMLEHGEQLAEALIQNEPFPTIYRNRRYRFYDSLLLSILKEEPHWGKPIFKQLFQNVKTPRVLSFLGEKMTLRQEIPLLLSLPILPFLRALDREYIKGSIKGFFSLFQTRQILVWASILLVFIHQLLPAATHLIALPLLGAGLIFPGIPHGALDHVLEGKPPSKTAHWLQFIGIYVGIMLAIVGLWWLSPELGLALFLLYSAWHFGETDLKHWAIKSTSTSWIYGLSSLGFILGTHPVELIQYLQALGVSVSETPPIWISLLLFAPGLAFPLQNIPRDRIPSYIKTIVILTLGTALPLLLAFALYFVGLHSWRAWRHLRTGLQMSDRRLLQHAAPFSIGAYLFLALFALAIYCDILPFEGLPSAIFLFLAAISAPHIWMMHSFYGK
ncbi:MAG: beta-carotene 15,15'-dioxygenase, Brp/Blh family [Bacteroidetes bacterium]|jgi:lycopene beta-cyclase|nr:beta-carotene 15,15'-dioxygenase, Brp/Blh family [Bacteroidota bacterium]